MRRCSNCKHYRPMTQGEGTCRRLPPVMEGATTRFPIVPLRFDCGEHKFRLWPRKKVKVEEAAAD